MKIDIEIIKPDEYPLNIHHCIYKMIFFNKLDHQNSNNLDIILNTFIQGGVKKILLDFSNIQYIDSTGIGCIIQTAKTLRKLKGEVTITKCSSHIMEIFKLVRLEKFIKLFNSIEEGINFLKFS